MSSPFKLPSCPGSSCRNVSLFPSSITMLGEDDYFHNRVIYTLGDLPHLPSGHRSAARARCQLAVTADGCEVASSSTSLTSRTCPTRASRRAWPPSRQVARRSKTRPRRTARAQARSGRSAPKVGRQVTTRPFSTGSVKHLSMLGNLLIMPGQDDQPRVIAAMRPSNAETTAASESSRGCGTGE